MEESASVIDIADTPQWVERMTLRVEDALREMRTLAVEISADQIRLARARMTGQGKVERARQVDTAVSGARDG